MTCWDWGLCVLLVPVAIGFTWSGLHFWHRVRCPACRTARRAVQEQYPDCRVSDSSHRATEPDRVVVAVFYSPPFPHVIEPEPYRLVAVLSNGEVEERPHDPDSPYRLLGRK